MHTAKQELPNEETGINTGPLTPEQIIRYKTMRLEQAEKNSKCYLALDEPLYDVYRMSKLLDHYVGLLMHDHKAWEVETKEIQMNTEFALLIDFGVTHLHNMITKLREVYNKDNN